MPVLHHQPFRSLYLVYFVMKTLCVKLPFWTLVSLLPSTRPKPSWSIRKCLRVYLLRTVVALPIKLGLDVKRDLSKEVPNSTLRDAKFAWVDVAEVGVLTGEVQRFAERTGVKPARVPGYWQLKKGRKSDWTPKAKEGEKVVYHLHGGAFWLGTAHPSDTTAGIPRGILKYSKTIRRTFAVDYRLSSSAPFKAENPFPAGLLDCIAGYQYLIGMGFRAENIVVAGDSAGGNLALALVRHLCENTTGLEKPGKLLLLSPWGDLSSSRNGPDSSLAKNRKTDMFPTGQSEFGAYGVTSYIGTELKQEVKTSKYLSPTSPHLGAAEEGMFEGFPRTYVLAGGAERILDDSEVLAARMKRDSGGRENWVTLDVTADAIHDFTIFPWHEPERGEALARVSSWIDEE